MYLQQLGFGLGKPLTCWKCSQSNYQPVTGCLHEPGPLLHPCWWVGILTMQAF
jgi:hypothetical protein